MDNGRFLRNWEAQRLDGEKGKVDEAELTRKNFVCCEVAFFEIIWVPYNLI